MQIDQILKPGYFEMSLKVLEEFGRMVVFIFSLDCQQRIREAMTLISRSGLKHWYYTIYTAEAQVNVTGHPRYFPQVDGLFVAGVGVVTNNLEALFFEKNAAAG